MEEGPVLQAGSTLYSESHCNYLLQILCVNQQPLLQARDVQKAVTKKVKTGPPSHPRGESQHSSQEPPLLV